MRLDVVLTPADRACPDCGEKAHAALDRILAADLRKGIAKGGEVDALAELERLVTAPVDKRLKALAKAARGGAK